MVILVHLSKLLENLFKLVKYGQALVQCSQNRLKMFKTSPQVRMDQNDVKKLVKVVV
jgi:hypothetical protein